MIIISHLQRLFLCPGNSYCKLLDTFPTMDPLVFSASGEVSLERVTLFVLDEADRMLECGFEEQVGRVGKILGPATLKVMRNQFSCGVQKG